MSIVMCCFCAYAQKSAHAAMGLLVQCAVNGSRYSRRICRSIRRELLCSILCYYAPKGGRTVFVSLVTSLSPLLLIRKEALRFAIDLYRPYTLSL